MKENPTKSNPIESNERKSNAIQWNPMKSKKIKVEYRQCLIFSRQISKTPPPFTNYDLRPKTKDKYTYVLMYYYVLI